MILEKLGAMGDDAAVETDDDGMAAGEDGNPRWMGLAPCELCSGMVMELTGVVGVRGDPRLMCAISYWSCCCCWSCWSC